MRERARPDIGVRRDVQQRLDWKKPPGVAWRCAGQGFVDDARGLGVSTGDDQLRGLKHGRIDSGRTAARLPAADVNGRRRGRLERPGGHESQLRHRVRGHTFDGARKCRGGVCRSTLPQPERADGVPRVCRALARIELTGILERQLALELLERARLVAARQVNEAQQPVQRTALNREPRIGGPAWGARPAASSRSASPNACRATWTVAASQWASAKSGKSVSVRCAARRRSSPQLTYDRRK